MSDGPVRKYSFVQLDVFSSRPLEGNPLAVFTDGSGLTDDEMQALAREMNLSETTFVFPRSPEVERERGCECASSRPKRSFLLRAILHWEPPWSCAKRN